MNATLSRRPLRRFWGWGVASEHLTQDESARIGMMVQMLGGQITDRPEPQVSDFTLPAPRIAPPSALAEMFSATPLDRLNHAMGKSYADLARMWLRQVPHVPDWVAYPDDEQAVIDILDWAARHNVAVIPYGGGSSVCGGVEAAVGNSYAAAVSLDMERLNRVLEVDPISRAARIQAGALGPELEAQLKPHGYTLRHYPQSFEFSTLGGWIVTRAGGHYATLMTHIDDLVENTRMVTPSGVCASRRLPASGAGPSQDRLVLGFESADHPLNEWMRRALELVSSHGGSYDAESVERSMRDEGGEEHRSGTAGAWRQAFLRMPYWRDPAVGNGLIMDTFETATTWNNFEAFYKGVRKDVAQAVQHATGHPAFVSCRFTHIYPDGPAPYFTIAALGSAQGDVASALAAWREIKQAANEAVIKHGGTITHHHAVGRDHRPGYEQETPALYRQMLQAAKATVDPQGILNPGVLIDPRDRQVGITGALA